VAFAAVLSRHGLGALGERDNYYPTAEAYRERLERHSFKVENIALIPRPTPLNESGMNGWLNTFYRGAIDALPADLRNTAVDETVALLAPVLRGHDGHWTADYVRLRFIARVKQSGGGFHRLT
jgi:hypothetical protein